MNSELIKKFADEARIKPMGSSWAYRLSDEFEEKFAELIVRECADVATINAHQWASPGTYVLKHFGVE